MGERPGTALTATAELVRRAGEGDRDAVEELVAKLRPRLVRWAKGRLPFRARRQIDTEDLVQDSLAAAVGHLESLEAPEAFPAYARRTVLNRLADLRRRPRPETTLADDAVAVDRGPSPAERFLRTEQLAAYERALAELSPRDQQAVIGNLEWGLSHRELAQELGLGSPDAARMAATRALARLARGIGS